MKRLALPLALAAALAAPAALHAQDRPPRDTIVIVTPGQEDSASADTLRLNGDGTPRRPARRPFEVRSSGRVAPHGPPRDVVWMHPDSIRRARGPDADSAAADPASADSIVMARADDRDSSDEDDPEVVVLDTASADSDDSRPSRRRSTDEEDAPSTRRRNSDEADEPPARRRSADADEDAEAAPRRPSSRTASRDSTASGRRATTRADSTASRRSTTRTASRDTASTRRTTTPAARTTSGRPRTHTVASGETFFGIARRYGVTTAQLRALNPDVDWETLPVGTELRLPAGARNPTQSGQRTTSSDDDERPAQRPASTSTPARGRRTHTVAQGETLYGIARRYGVTVDAIREANDLEGDALRIGRTLVIPRAPQR